MKGCVVRLRSDRGAIAPMVPIIILFMLVLGGLVVDGSRTLNGRGEAQAYAEEAARAGATAVDLASDQLILDPALANQRVADYCATITARQPDLRIECGPDNPEFAVPAGGNQPIIVRTKVTMTVRPTLLGVVWSGGIKVSGSAQARPFEGVTTANTQ